RVVDLRSLDNWQLTEQGLFERTARQGFSVEYYEVRTEYREVGAWVQPLINSSDAGQAVLCCRRNHGHLEFLVITDRERGLCAGAAVLPSYLRYPGQKGPSFEQTIEREFEARSVTTLAKTIESDEGGRFYNDVNHYEIALLDLDEDHNIKNGHWVTC